MPDLLSIPSRILLPPGEGTVAVKVCVVVHGGKGANMSSLRPLEAARVVISVCSWT